MQGLKECDRRRVRESHVLNTYGLGIDLNRYLGARPPHDQGILVDPERQGFEVSAERLEKEVGPRLAYAVSQIASGGFD